MASEKNEIVISAVEALAVLQQSIPWTWKVVVTVPSSEVEDVWPGALAAFSDEFYRRSQHEVKASVMLVPGKG